MTCVCGHEYDEHDEDTLACDVEECDCAYYENDEDEFLA